MTPGTDELIKELAATGRIPTDSETEQLRTYIAQAGFDPQARERARGLLSGLDWQGRVLVGRDVLPPTDVHYLRHVVLKKEWPAGTTPTDFIDSLWQVVRSDSSGIFLSHYQSALQVGCIGHSGDNRGPGGFDWILVEYRVDTGFWVTGFQLEWASLISPQRTNVRWLRNPQ